jgi:hypothetical protein
MIELKGLHKAFLVLLTILLVILPISPITKLFIQPVAAYTTVGMPECAYSSPVSNGYCFIRGNWTPLVPNSWDEAAECWRNYYIYYPSNNKTYYFCSSRHDLANREVTVIVQWSSSATFYYIREYNLSSYYNQIPNPPNISYPQYNWVMGPRNNTAYGLTLNCGTGLGCNAPFRVISHDPDYYNFLLTYVDLIRNEGGNANYSFNGNGQNDINVALTDGHWNISAVTQDQYAWSSPTPNSGHINFIVDTTPPSVPDMIAEPEYSTGIQNTVSVITSTDAIVGGVEYFFEISTDSTFTAVIQSSGWVNSSLWTFGGIVDPLLDETQYYYRAKARDSQYNESTLGVSTNSIQDSTLPIIQNVTAGPLRISPSNTDNINDFIQLDFEFLEKYPKEVLIEVKDLNDNIIYSDTTDYASLPIPNTTQIANSFTWNGLKSDATIALDGIYNIEISAIDRAGNITVDNSTNVILDNIGATISISNPINGSWFNEDNIVINGQTRS